MIPLLKQRHHTSKYSFNTSLSFVPGGKPYFDLIANLIDTASLSIHVQCYIFDEDRTGTMIAEKLIMAANRGVSVYILVDGYASQNLSKHFIEKIRSAGIKFKFFEPLLKSKYFYFGRRLHHKIVVIDTVKAVIGGLNISDKYNDFPSKAGWLDFALLVEGEVAKELCILCWKTWNGYPINMELTPCESVPTPKMVFKGPTPLIRMIRNDWIRRKVQISNVYNHMFRTAKKEIIILSSYFIPGNLLRTLISQAINRGVNVKVVSAGYSDVKIAKDAERWLYDWLLRNNIELYEYQKNVLHGKLGICDGEWFTLGSYNINDLSAHASIELNLEVIDTPLTQEFRSIINQIIKEDCIQITLEGYKKTKNVFKQLKQWFAFEILRMLYYVFTFYTHQRK